MLLIQLNGTEYFSFVMLVSFVPNTLQKATFNRKLLSIVADLFGSASRRSFVILPPNTIQSNLLYVKKFFLCSIVAAFTNHCTS